QTTSTMSAERDAEVLNKAFKGLGMDEKTLINMLTHRNVNELQEINRAYKGNFGKSLEEKIEISTNFYKDVSDSTSLLLFSPAEYDAKLLNDAMKGVGTDEDLLIQVLAGRTNVEVEAIKAAYSHVYGKDLEKAVMSEVGGDLRKFFVAMLQARRDEEGAGRNVAEDVKELYEAGEGKIGTDESKFIQVIANRAPSHVQAVIRQYALTYGHDITHAIRHELSGDLKRALTTAVKRLADPADYYAEMFEKSMAGLGTKDEMLVRLLVRTRYPQVSCLMSAVKEAYLKRYGKTLAKRVSGETSGDYKKLAVAIIEVAP
ncbi:annexin A13-like protein, partial [Gonapodya prolifera JEL478]